MFTNDFTYLQNPKENIIDLVNEYAGLLIFITGISGAIYHFYKRWNNHRHLKYGLLVLLFEEIKRNKRNMPDGLKSLDNDRKWYMNAYDSLVSTTQIRFFKVKNEIDIIDGIYKNFKYNEMVQQADLDDVEELITDLCIKYEPYTNKFRKLWPYNLPYVFIIAFLVFCGVMIHINL